MKSLYRTRSTLFIISTMGIAACANIILDPYYLENGIDIAKISLISSQAAIVFIVMDVISSYVFDKISKRLSMSLCSLFNGAAMLILASARAPFFFEFVLLAAFAMSTGNAFMSGASQALVLEELDDRENLKANLAKMRIAGSAATIIGYCIGLLVSQAVSYREILFVVGVLGLAMSPLAVTVLPKNRFKEKISFSRGVIRRDMRFALLVIFGGKRGILSLSSLGVGIASGTLGLYALYLLDPKAALLIVFLRRMLSHGLGILNSKLSIHMGTKTMSTVGLILGLITTAAVALRTQLAGSTADEFVLLAIMILSGSTSFYALFPVGTYFQRRIPHRLRSTVMSYRKALGSLSFAAALPVTARLYEFSGTGTLLGLSIMVPVIVVVLSLPGVKPQDFHGRVRG